jgi:DNA-binding NtrC family response regulator
MALRIFYIDDEVGLCDAFTDNFSADDMTVYSFTDADLAVRQIDELKPDLIFIDYRLGRVTADQVLPLIPEGIKVALISGDLAIQHKDRYVRVFPKPFEHAEVTEFLEAVSRGRSS